MAARRPIPVHLQPYVDMVTKSRLLAPNLKTLTLSFFAGRANAGNDVAREVVRDHLLALRWMNPNAVVYLREERGQGVPEVQYELWTGGGMRRMLVRGSSAAEEVVARVLQAARDPAEEEAAAAVSVGGAGQARKARMSLRSAGIVAEAPVVAKRTEGELR